MSRVWEHSRAQGSSLLLLLAIADHADDAGSAYPGVTKLAAKSRMSERNTQYGLKRLQASGELEIKRGAGPRGTNVYRITIADSMDPAAAYPAKFAPAKFAPGATGGRKGVQASVASGATAIAPEPSSKHQKNRQEYAHAFEEAWELYPERAGNDPKPDAYKQWQARLRDGHTEQELLQGVRRFRAYCDAKGDTGTQFVMQARKFFGEGKPFAADWKLPKSALSKHSNFATQNTRTRPVNVAQGCDRTPARARGTR